MPALDSSTIHVAFRFHVNLYHSYRGDSLDERGIGKDIRIIRGILRDLETLNGEGLPVRAAWDLENYYSLELYLPRHAPDIIEGIGRRVAEGRDEAELMSWNNGLLTAHDPEELEEALRLGISNPEGSGIRDLFGSWAPIARPQECMFSAAQIPVYRKVGLEAVSLYYSAAPFNGFSSFVSLLEPAKRYNPLRLRDEATGQSIRILPSYNPADVAETWFSLRRRLMAMRKAQLKEAEPTDYLFILDMDADDSFWEGHVGGLAARLFPSFGGFGSLVRSVADLPWLRFTRPYDYLREHEDAGEIRFGQDLADGSFEGYSSWSEKAENLELWTVLAEARRLRKEADRRALSLEPPDEPAFASARGGAMRAYLRALSTTHFGMASPVMNVDRLQDAFSRADEARRAAEAALRASGAAAASGPALQAVQAAKSAAGDFRSGADFIQGGGYTLAALPEGGLMLYLDGEALFEAPLSLPWVDYAGRPRRARMLSLRAEAAEGSASLEAAGLIPFPGGAEAAFSHRYTLAAGMPGVSVDIRMEYPSTARRGFDKAKAARLGRAWDARWRQVAPFELLPRLDLGGGEGGCARVWSQGFLPEPSSYALDYHLIGPNRDLDSLNNSVTDSWIAIGGADRGVLLAQADLAQTLFAFCPMRIRFKGGMLKVFLNPYGSYYGRQWRYSSASTGMGRIAALLSGDNFDPYAPSWEGQALQVRLLIAPYRGVRPPAELRRAAEDFAHPARVF